jgi:hypothetical protein
MRERVTGCVRGGASRFCDWDFTRVTGHHKRKIPVHKEASTAYSSYAVVCRVKFKPISGYAPDDPNIKLMSHTDAIEVWLVSLRGTYRYVPYHILLPTESGLTVRNLNIVTRRTKSASKSAAVSGCTPTSAASTKHYHGSKAGVDFRERWSELHGVCGTKRTCRADASERRLYFR